MLLYRVSTAFDDVSSNGLTATSFLFLEIDMSEVKFTNGEWIVYAGDLRYCKGKVCIIESDDMPTVIADLNDYFGKESRDANAHLIAASPEMYAMLQELLDGGSLHRMDAKAISELLAKARGE